MRLVSVGVLLVALLSWSLGCMPFRSADRHVGKIVGVVTDAETARPVVGVCVLVVGTRLGAITDSTGLYLIRTVPEGSYELRASSIPFVFKGLPDVEVIAGSTTILSFTLQKDSNMFKPLLIGRRWEDTCGSQKGESGKQQKGTITGSVTDAQTGEPLVGASVWLEGAGLGGCTDRDGIYVIQSVAPSTIYSLRASSVGYESQAIDSISVPSRGVIQLKMELTKADLDDTEIVVR